MLTADRITHAYHTAADPLPVLDSISLSAADGEFVAIVGPSGSGKTTLLRILAGLIRPERGQVEWKAKETADGGPLTADLAPRLGMMFQTPSLMPWRSAFDNVLLPVQVGPEVGREKTGPAQRRARDLLVRVGLSGFEETLPRDLSGGMQSRVALARALMGDPELLLLDEPFAGLGAHEIADLSALIRRIHADEGLTVLLIEHRLHEFMKLVDRVIALDFGETIADDVPERIVRNPRVIEAYIGGSADTAGTV